MPKRHLFYVACCLTACLGAGARAGPDPEAGAARGDHPLFTLFDAGREAIVDYQKYGVFMNAGGPRYRYLIHDREGLARAVGEGIYPNITGLLKDPTCQKFLYSGQLSGPVWDYVNSDDLQAGFYKWASSHEPPGLKQFYTAEILEKAGLLTQAVKAYYATVVHFPKTAGNTFWKTPWYVGPTALDRVSFITRFHPDLGMRLVGGRIRIRNGFDDDLQNDIFEISPGHIAETPPNHLNPRQRVSLANLPVRRTLGSGKVTLRQLGNGHWQLVIGTAPYVLRGMSYSATPVGKSPDTGSWVPYRDWMLADEDKNGKIDGPYDSWVDRDRTDKQTADEPAVGDFKLMKDMGVNTLRLYHHAYNKTLLMDLFKTDGIRVIIGDFMGAYAIGSGADWYAGTDYSNAKQQDKMLESVRQVVEEYRNEPYVVFWVLGNENNYGNANNSRQIPEVYYKFVNRAARLIKSLDADHPVAICNGDLLHLDKIAKFCPDVDILGANAYRGNHGFGDSFWQNISEVWGKPVFITEFGCPAYHHRRSPLEAEALQADYLRSNWEDIEFNLGGGQGVGNALGGVIFEWMDEWWKAGPPPQYDPAIHDIVGQFGGPFPDGWSYEEWYGVTGQGNGNHSPFERQLRKAYFLFKDELWDPQKMSDRGLPE